MESGRGPIQSSSRDRGFGRFLLDALAQGVLNTVAFGFKFLAWLLGWTLATVLFIALMGGAGYYVFSKAVEGGVHVNVPDVVHKPITEAQFLLAEANLMLGKQTYHFTEEVPEYHVIAQRPTADEVVRAGRKIFLTVSAGRGKVETPKLVGRSLTDARTQIASSRLLAGTEARMHSEQPMDTVIGQEPLAGRTVSVGEEINILVSSGPKVDTLLMPAIEGKTMRVMVELLAPLQAVLTPKIVTTGAKEDVVLRQYPQAGTPVTVGQHVVFEVYVSGNVLPIPGAPDLFRIYAFYEVPASEALHQVRVDLVNKDGVRTTVQEPADYEAGWEIVYKGLASDDQTVEFYLDGDRVRSFVFTKDEKAPEIIDHTLESNEDYLDLDYVYEGESNAETEDSTVYSFE